MQQLGECSNSTSYTALVNRKSHVPLYDIHTTAEYPTQLHAWIRAWMCPAEIALKT